MVIIILLAVAIIVVPFLLMLVFLLMYSNKKSQYTALLQENKLLKKQIKQLEQSFQQLTTAQQEPSTEQTVSTQQTQLPEQTVSTQQSQPTEQALSTQQSQPTKQALLTQQSQLTEQALLTQQVQTPKFTKEQIIKREKEQKNTAILVTGAICIVLSAIVFLMSTWNVIPNILKTTVLVLLTSVFLGGSSLAKNKFKLEKVGQTFFYLAMAYIPICLLSISVFELLGHYLSIYGEGKYIYLTIVSLFLAILYYSIYKNMNNTSMFYGSILSQVFSVIAFSLIMSDDIEIIVINLLVYNILLIILTKTDIFIKIQNIIPAIIATITIFDMWNKNTTLIFVFVLLAVNYLLLEIKKSHLFYSYMFNISLILVGLYTAVIYNDYWNTDISHLVAILFVVLVYVIESILIARHNRNNLKNSLSVTIITTFSILHIESYINENMITPYMISLIQVIILVITYIKSKAVGRNIASILIPIYFILTGINIFDKLDCSYHAYVIFALVTCVLIDIFRKKDKLLYTNMLIILNVFLIVTYWISSTLNYDEFTYNVVYSLSMLGIYIYTYLANKNMAFKYLAYASSNFVFFTIFQHFVNNEEILLYIPLITTLLVMIIEMIFKKCRDVLSDSYIAVSEITAFALIYWDSYYKENLIATVVALIFTLLIIGNNIVFRHKLWNILPLTFIMPIIFDNNFSKELEIAIMISAIITTSLMSIKERRISVFTIFSGIYLIFSSTNIDYIYLNIAMYICWSLIHYLMMNDNKIKDKFKFSLYVSILILYNTIISDLELEDYTLCFMLGYIIVAMLTIRTIIIKYTTTIDVYEYIAFGLLYLSAFSEYNSEQDGMLFVILLVIMVIISYIKKYGALFMTTIFAIIFNIIMLTREFWFSVPWWGYLLTIGIILIIFAIRNEASDKKNEKKALDLLKNIKDKIDDKDK